MHLFCYNGLRGVRKECLGIFRSYGFWFFSTIEGGAAERPSFVLGLGRVSRLNPSHNPVTPVAPRMGRFPMKFIAAVTRYVHGLC